jgi:biopolymer transport protein ExbB
MISVIQKGGPLVYLILFCSVLALAVVIERLFHLYRARIDTGNFLSEISASIKKNKIVEAIDLCDKTPGPVAHTLKAGILRHDSSREEIKEAVNDAAIHEIPRLEKNLGILATIAHITPLLGLLGTVNGMINCFQVIQQKASAFNPVSPADLAQGIWVALITTAAGLTVAIPTLVAYNYLVSRVNNFILDMEKSATDLVDILSQRSKSYEV